MGPDFLENIDHAFLYPSSEKTDGLTALDRGKSNICDLENLWSLTLCEELLGETTHPDPSLTAGASSTTNTANQAAVAFQRMSIGRDSLFNFLKLPREIRDQIYNLCLITEYEIVMHPEEYELSDVPAFGADDQPCVALLQLNKQVYAESFPVFYGKNTFRLPTNVQHNAIYQKYSREIHHVTVHLDYREVTDQEKRAIAIAEHMAPDTDFAPTRPDAARWRHIHKRHLDLMIAKWQPLDYNSAGPVMVLLSGALLPKGNYLFGPLPPIRERLTQLDSERRQNRSPRTSHRPGGEHLEHPALAELRKAALVGGDPH